jgi:hypothetical protein
MKRKKPLIRTLAVFLALLLGAPQGLMAQSAGEGEASQEVKAQSTGAEEPFKQEELDQLLAPIALYPDSLLTQIMMASTYPLEIVQADRWAKENKDMKGDALAKALEEQPWDPSVKSLVNFPDILSMMNEKLDMTQKLGDAFLAQQKEVMDTIQNLRKKAEASGNLETTEEQKVIVEKETIIIESADPQVIYVPSYNPTVVYGSWWYPAYPPYPYYPPGYGTGAAFVTGVAIGAAWGYAWGHSNWHGGDVDIDINRNTNINNNINRDKYKNQGQGRGQGGQSGQGKWQHDSSHRGGVAYKDQGTAQKYNRGTGSEAAKSREGYRGKAEAGRQEIARGGADQMRGGSAGSRQQSAARPDTGSLNRSGTQQKANNSAFGSSAGGAQTRSASSRGHQSMSSSRGGGMSRGGGGGMSRGGGGGMSRGGGGGRGR